MHSYFSRAHNVPHDMKDRASLFSSHSLVPPLLQRRHSSINSRHKWRGNSCVQASLRQAEFNTLVLTYKALNSLGSGYLKEHTYFQRNLLPKEPEGVQERL